MESYRSARQFGIWVILLTMLFRVFETGLPQGIYRKLKTPPASDIQTDKQTGHPVRSVSIDALFPFIAESSPPTDVLVRAERPAFSPEDAAAISLVNTGSENPDLEKLLCAPLELHLTGKKPTVLILHTHTTESYTKCGEDYTESSEYRTLDEDFNMLSIGDRVAELLEDAGICAFHDRQIHDYPSYTGAYNHARKAIQAALEENPEIQLVLDLHRDAAESKSGQYRTAVQIDGREGAQLMFVLGCGNAGLKHPDWEENLGLALKLQSLLERRTPGICRPLSLRPQRFNQDLCSGALLVEIGSAGNTHAEALLAAEQLAQAITELKNGTEEA